MTIPDAKQPRIFRRGAGNGGYRGTPGPEKGLLPRSSGGIRAGGRCRTSPTLVCWCRLWLQVAGEMMDALTRTSMSRASAWGERPAPSSLGRHPTQRYPSRPCPATSESGLYRRPVADTPFSSDPLAVRGGRFYRSRRRGVVRAERRQRDRLIIEATGRGRQPAHSRILGTERVDENAA